MKSGSARLATEEGSRILCTPLSPVPRLLVLGAGLDAIPLVGMAAELGWFVTVADHRPGYLARGGFERAERAVLVEPGKLAASLPLRDFAAIVVMSHHLATDRQYLAELSAFDTRYLGVLGPRARRDRLLAELRDVAPSLHERLKGPVGLDIGADSPESIALSILAELQATLSAR
jgi:xanthine/CO dehydrogenase XdhC/CoxF family maturation factor